MAWLVATTLGILIELILQRYSTERKKVINLYIGVIGGCVAVLIYNLLGKTKEPGLVYEIIKSCGNLFMKSIVCQTVCLILIVLIIIHFYNENVNMCLFEEYSKKIQEFTNNAREGSKISVIAGDMDFFGKIANEDIKIEDNELIENSQEYLQLCDLKEQTNLRVICNSKLEKALKETIINGTIDVAKLYGRNRDDDTLRSGYFQQLLRIGKMKYEFKSRIEFRYYNTEEDDKQLRARFIEPSNYDIKGIVYHKENAPKRYSLFAYIKKKFQKEQIAEREEMYSVHYLNKDEIGYYKDMYEMKWRECNEKDSNIITDFCEDLYKFAVGIEKDHKMALIYVKSYEVARKKERKEFPPFGVLYLAAVVLEKGWNVEIFSVDENHYDLPLEEFDVVGFSIVSSYSYKFLKRCYDVNSKKMRKDVVKIAGGYQAEKFSENVFQDFKVDIIFKGEGEESIRELVDNFQYRNYGKIKGIMYKGNNNEIIHTDERSRCVDVDKLPFPARQLLNREDIVMTDRLAGKEIPMVHMLFSRGCKYNCYYCAANHDGKNSLIRYRAKENIVDELKEMISKYEIEGFSIIDDCFLTDINAAGEICDYIAKSKLNLKWSLAARADQINKKTLETLKKAGCIEIKFGIETGSNDLLKSMGKGFNVDCAKRAIKLTHNAGIGVKVFIISGLPGETDTTHKETINFLNEMKGFIDRISLLRFTPLAGSYVYSHAKNFDIDQSMLNIEYFDKMRLYRKSANWWKDKDRFDKCEKWYKEMQDFIDDNWTDK